MCETGTKDSAAGDLLETEGPVMIRH